ncbi:MULTISPECIES: hypothetical protein [unclassified Aureispira]|uniref:hypothetical protein n=1 Tax=unclassified Aureispira TaxID=2649989 RepID=UPI0006974C53|nr:MULTISPECIES: hypothetical protein [unclassified Aureispira]WMX15223.1 hypothetical protein QP953_02415 [Aureispira sp. CCB-E]
MKNMSKLLMLVAVVLFAVSCDNANPTQSATVASADKIDLNSHRGAKETHQTIDRFSLADIDVNLEAMETVAMEQMNQENADAQDIMNMNAALMGAEKEAQLLEVKFSMSDEPVENGMFIFSIESPDGKNLTLEMYDEEGYAKVANNKFDVTEGNNYKALNVNSMEDGDYLFRLKDDEGRELVRTVNISNEK